MDGKNLAVDAVALAVYAVVANPAVTGIALHEWLGLGLKYLPLRPAGDEA